MIMFCQEICFDMPFLVERFYVLRFLQHRLFLNFDTSFHVNDLFVNVL